MSIKALRSGQAAECGVGSIRDWTIFHAGMANTMSQEQALSLYLELSESIHAYWAGFGVVAILLFGWVISRDSPPNLSQRITLTLGWFVAGGYLTSSLREIYRIMHAVSQDLLTLRKAHPQNDSNVLQAITELSSVYERYEILVWMSFGLISICVLFVVWSNVLFPKTQLVTRAAIDALKADSTKRRR